MEFLTFGVKWYRVCGPMGTTFLDLGNRDNPTYISTWDSNTPLPSTLALILVWCRIVPIPHTQAVKNCFKKTGVKTLTSDNPEINVTLHWPVARFLRSKPNQ